MKSAEEIMALVMKAREEKKHMTKEKMVEIIMNEGLDSYIDFKINDEHCPSGSVRLNEKADGSFELISTGERGIDFQKTFTNPAEAYSETISLLRLIQGEVKRFGAQVPKPTK